MRWFFFNILVPFCAGWGAVDLIGKFLMWWFMGPRYKDNYDSW